MKYILGISAFYHDSAACLIRDGEIIAAAHEERFSRKKFDKRFPVNAVLYCLREANIRLSEIGAVAFYEKPRRKFARIVSDVLYFAPRTREQFLHAMPEWLGGKYLLDQELAERLRALDPAWNGKLLFAEHHESHAASAFFPSPFEKAAVLVFDAVGEWTSTSIHLGDHSRLIPLKEQHFPHSLGALYSSFTHYLGFKVNSGEYKMMGLAPYGQPTFVDRIMDNLIDYKEDGSFRLNLDYFGFTHSLRMITPAFEELFGGPARKADQPINAHHMNIAASIQKVTETIVLDIARYASRETQQQSLCLAGGVALNCVANGVLLRSGIFKKIWIQPAAGDSGGSVGAALSAYHRYYKAPRRISPNDSDAMKGALLGPDCSCSESEQQLIQSGAIFEKLDEKLLLDLVAKDLENGLVVGWCQGRMEFGPRALGNRSILGDPRNPKMQSTMNLKIKFRESFRPFAPSVLYERAPEFFEMDVKSPYMLLVAGVQKNRRKTMPAHENTFGIDLLNLERSDIPAVTHVDYSARIQTVHAETNPKFYALLKAFEHRTGCAVLINTSFNVRGEPIVCNARDAFRCFMGTHMDVLVVGDFYLRKDSQTAISTANYKNSYELD